jgi:hypothetical protein
MVIVKGAEDVPATRGGLTLSNVGDIIRPKDG